MHAETENVSYLPNGNAYELKLDSWLEQLEQLPIKAAEVFLFG